MLYIIYATNNIGANNIQIITFSAVVIPLTH